MLNNSKVLEVMAGCGRNIEVYGSYNPSSIDIVDINPEMIKKAKELHPTINAYALELTTWLLSNFERKYECTFPKLRKTSFNF